MLVIIIIMIIFLLKMTSVLKHDESLSYLVGYHFAK